MTETIELARLDLRDHIRAGDVVVWGQGCGEPLSLTETLTAQRHAIGPIEVFTGLCFSATADPQFADVVRFATYYGGGGNRRLGDAGKLDIFPSHYSQLPDLLRARATVLMLQLSPPDAAGRCSLGLSHDYLIPLLDTARTVIGEINDHVPWIKGERTVAMAELDVAVRTSRPPVEMQMRAADDIERAVAANVAGLIEDGATLQIGIGSIPSAILAALHDRRHLGIHSGALFDPVADLIAAGAVDNSRKGIDAGVTIAGSLFGTRRIWNFCARKPDISMRSVAYTHDISVLSRLQKLAALNSAIEIDLTGQINAEVAGGRYVGAVGGAVDFIRGAHRSPGGLPITALRSRAGGKRTIVAALSGPVSTPRADAGIVVTEHGIADLRGQTLRERARRLVAIAHPDDRETLERDAHAMFGR